MDRFKIALAHVFYWEGGFSDHPSDPGGATNFGITQGTLAAWRGKAVSREDVRALTRQEAGAIYRARYWDACRCDDLPAGVDAMVFDAAVNHGPRQAALFLQRALGVSDDGVIGPQTLAAAARLKPGDTICEIAARRMVFYARLNTFPTFGLGWARRLMSTLEKATLMVAMASLE
jgi:lysozyme family protein